MTGGSRGRQAALPSRDYVDYYNAERRHRSLGGRTPLEVWRGDSTPVERIAPEQARWMLKARQERVIGNDGIHHRGRIYFASEFGGLVGERVEVAFMPHDLRTVDVYHDGRFLATAREQHKLTEAQKQEAPCRCGSDPTASGEGTPSSEAADRADHGCRRDRRARTATGPSVAAAGAGGVAAARTEQDGATIHNSATLQLSNQLGIDLANADPRTATPAHVEILGAILADLREPVQAQAIAATLDWSVEHVHAVANHLRRKLQRLGQTVTRSASDHLSLAVHPVNLADHEREQIRAEVLTIDQTTASVVLRVIEERRRDRYCGALNPEEQHAATELIAAGAITTSHDLLSPSERLENAIDNRHLTELRW